MRDAVINFDWIKDKHYKVPSVDKAMPNQEGQKLFMAMPRAPKATASCAQVIDCVEGARDLVLHDVTVDDFHVTGDTFLDGNTDIGWDLNVDGNTTLVDLHVTNNLDVDGTATVDTLNVTNIIVGPGADLSGMISSDANQCLILGTDGKLYVACWGGPDPFTCFDVADCIDNSATVQEALSNWFIDALLTDVDLQTALNAYELNYIENTNFTLNGDWDFQGNITINWVPVGASNAVGETQNFVGTGAQVAFVLSNTPADPDLVWISGNGVFDQDGIALDYTIAGATITFNAAPANGYKIQVKYIRSIATVVSDPMTTAGDIIIRDATNVTTRLALGSANRVLKSNGTIPAYGTFIKVGTTAAMAGTALAHADADATTTSIVNWTASGTPNWFIQVVPTAWTITFTSTVAETVSFTYSLIKA